MSCTPRVCSTGLFRICCKCEKQSHVLPHLTSVCSNELIEIREFKDDPTLSNIATVIAVTLSAVTPPDGVAQEMINTILSILRTTSSWRIRLHTLPLLAVLHYRQLPLLGESSNTLIMDVRLQCRVSRL
jgi:hypothetical protein